jgi:ectoine hydroxylase-related dioxygenase (phytanoyl-CoA dioxygenase family)
MKTLEDAATHFSEHGYVVLRSYLSAAELAPAQAELGMLFPTGDEYHAGTDPDRNAQFAPNAFAGIQQFPYESVEWSLLGLSPSIVSLAEAVLGTNRIRLYEAHNWAKYAGATEYEQALHRDYGNHTPVVPTSDRDLAEVEMFVYIHDVPIDCGPTYVVSQQHTRHLPQWPPRATRDAAPELYDHEVAADGPAGTVLAYRMDTMHRGSAITNPRGSRFVLKASYRTVSDIWIDKLGLSERLGEHWHRFVNRASARQLELAGFPPPRHPYWTAETWAGTRLRYPDADLSAFEPGARD